MARLEELTSGASIRGITPTGLVTVLARNPIGADVVDLTYRDAAGQAGTVLLYRDDEARLEVVTEGQPWSFDADGELLRLVSEAQRIRLAHLFDPYLAIYTSEVDPLPHQITAVYEKMLPRQPLRFLLADDPGSGKTIMGGLLIKEMIMRGDLQRCLIVCPGSLVEQWQDELFRRFGLSFDILTRERIEASRTGNVFQEMPLLLVRLDQLARNDELCAKLEQVDWDLIVVDEAHKMSATFFGGEINYTKRYRLGQRLSEATRHFLLMTATPHNGKEEDFQLFMALLDGDRFEGRFRDGVHTADVSDLMRRMVKEQLLKFDGKPLFPERRAYTVPYRLSNLEARLYHEVTAYVRNEFDRVQKLESDGRAGTVGFALTILQRRLASSPAAIHESLKRRRERLESRLREAELLARGEELSRSDTESSTIDDLDDLEDDLPADEFEALQDQVLDQATAARTVAELRIEIQLLRKLESLALQVRQSGTDRKWEELRRLLLDEQAMYDANGQRRKLVIFTEHRDTLTYLADQIQMLLGKAEAVVTIHGGKLREERRKAQELFTQDKAVTVLLATDAAGEGINLQRAHLMINYDLPWNPNRLEQRFGRIHRIGQTEVCHLWNLLAEETREGDVYAALLYKLEQERKSLGGAVFDVLGKAISGKELRAMLLEAIRYGDQPEVRARLDRKVEGALDEARLRTLMNEHALVHDIMDVQRVQSIRYEMERMEARRLQPHYVASFFKAAFEHLGGTLREREKNRYEIPHVPAEIRRRDRLLGIGEPVLDRYQRICFDKAERYKHGKPQAAFISPGHPLLNATLDLILERHRDLMKQGSILVDDQDAGEAMRALFYLEHAIHDGKPTPGGRRREISRRLQFIEIPLLSANRETYLDNEQSRIRNAGHAPYLDYRPLTPEEGALVAPLVAQTLATRQLEQDAIHYAVTHLVPEHLREVRALREPLIAKTMAAVKERLTKEIIYWDNRAIQLELQERSGKGNARLNSARARQRRDELETRLQQRMAELALEKQISAQAPNAIGGALVIPLGLLQRLRGERPNATHLIELENKRVEMVAMHAVMAVEQQLGHVPTPVYRQKGMGYDIEARPQSTAAADDQPLRMIEVKGFTPGSETITITRTEQLTACNKPDTWILALVQVPKAGDLDGSTLETMLNAGQTHAETVAGCRVCYVRGFFDQEPDLRSTGTTYPWKTLWAAGEVIGS